MELPQKYGQERLGITNGDKVTSSSRARRAELASAAAHLLGILTRSERDMEAIS